MKTPVANTNDPAVERNISRSDMDIVIAVSDKIPELNAVPAILSTIQVLEASIIDKASEVAANTLIVQSETPTIVSNAASALASKNAAGLSEINASNSANSATISKDNALASAVSANASAQSALNSKDSANLSAVSASASESVATTKANEASVSATSASVSATTATTQAGIATTKANEASVSATSATSSKNAAATSATNAANSASTATTKANEASVSASSALTSKNSASDSAVTASQQAAIATTKASEALTGANTSTTKASEASNSALEAKESRDTILNMQVATGLPNSSVTWDGTTLTVPKGADGIDGVDGISIESVIRTSGNGAAGTTDTYTITYTDNTTSTFTVYNGADGVGAGDMLKSTYDTNNSGVVDNSEKVNGLTVQTAVPIGALFTDTIYDDTSIVSQLSTKVTKNANITASTGTKITYDAKGLVTSSAPLIATDIPVLDTSKITTGTLVVARGGTGVTTSTGSGSVVLSTSPVLITPSIGVATGTSFNSITGLSSTTPVVAGTATIGTATTTARADHIHPAQTTITGNAGTATTLATSRNITIGSTAKAFNGSVDISWTVAEIGAQPVDADLTAISALAGTSGLLKKTATDTWALDTNTYVTSSGVTSIATSGAITGGTITSTGTISHSTADGYLHIPATGTTNSGKVLTAGATAGSVSWVTPTPGVTNHTLLTNIGTNTHAQIDTALTRLTNTSGSNTGDQTITLTGDVTGSGTGSFATTLKNTGTAGTYRSVTTDAQGRIVSGTNPTTVSGFGITDAYTKAEIDNLIGAINSALDTINGEVI